MSRKFSLEIVEGPDVGKIVSFKQGIVTIGRKATGNDLIFNNQTISGEHARISYRKRQFFIEDLGSTNKTRLNGTPVDAFQPVGLSHGDQLFLGNIALRFWKGAKSTKKTGPAKRVVAAPISHLPDDHQGKTAAGPFRLRRKRIVVCAGVVGVLLLALLGLKTFNGRSGQTGDSAADPPDLSAQPIALPAPDAYGYTGGSDNSHPDRAIFTFVAQTSRAQLFYTPGAVDVDGEVVISLNGTPLGDVPLAADGWGSEQVLLLNKGLLAGGRENRLVFDNTRNPPEKQMWGVKDLRIAFLPAVGCDLSESRRLFNLAENMYAEKAISAGNLFRAVDYYSQASASAGACAPKPEFWPTLETKLAAAEQELETRYKNLRFSYLKKIQLNQYPAAKKDLEAMLQLIPDKKDPRHKGPAGLLQKLNQILGNQG